MFSVIISVYIKEKPEFFELALQSIADQTLLPDELLIIEDGPLSFQLEEVIKKFKQENAHKFSIQNIKLITNVGLGLALKQGVLNAKNKFIVRMDSDDISSADRLFQMKELISRYPEYDVYGAQIQEFDSKTERILGIRKVPLFHDEIKKKMRIMNPMNHVTIVARRDSIIKAGNYEHFVFFEDYFLWAKMISQGFLFLNSPLVLVKVRAGKDMVKRRKGIYYARQELKMQFYLLRKGITNFILFIIVSIIRSLTRLFPGKLVYYLYKIIRNNKNEFNNQIR